MQPEPSDNAVSRKATVGEITIAVSVLFRNMPKARGVKEADRMEGYIMSLDGLSLEAIEGAVAKYLRGETALSPKYCPLPPELAQVAMTLAQRSELAARPASHKEPPKPLRKTAFLELWEEAGSTLAGFSRLMEQRPDYGQPPKKSKPPAPPPAERKVPDYSQAKVEVSPVLAKQLEERARQKALLDELQGTDFDMKPRRKRK